MGTEDRYHYSSDTEIATRGGERRERVVSFSGPLSGPVSKKRPGRKSPRFDISDSGEEDPYVEITLDVRDDTVAFHSLRTAGGADVEDPELALLAKGLEKKSSFGSAARNASARIRHVSQELKKLASFTRKPPARFDRSKSAAAHALKGLKFISKRDGGDGWSAVEKRFDHLTASSDGMLPRSLFSECIGMKESKEFAGELFDTLSRRRGIHDDSINKIELREFWEQISDQSFDTRLQTFFDM